MESIPQKKITGHVPGVLPLRARVHACVHARVFVPVKNTSLYEEKFYRLQHLEC